jgi:hypothetical protein
MSKHQVRVLRGVLTRIKARAQDYVDRCAYLAIPPALSNGWYRKLNRGAGAGLARLRSDLTRLENRCMSDATLWPWAVKLRDLTEQAISEAGRCPHDREWPAEPPLYRQHEVIREFRAVLGADQ